MAGTELGKAWVQIVPSAEGISGAIQNILDPEADRAGKSFGKRLKGWIVKAGVGTAVGKLFKDSLAEGAKLEQSFGGLDTLYGDASEAAKAYAKEAYKAGISTNNYAEQAVSFGAALRQSYGGDTAAAMEAANTAIMDMADNSAKMGTSLESIQNAYQGFAKQNYTMLDNLKLGYGGTKSEMERLLADAEKISGVHYDIKNLGDVYEAIHVMQQELGIAGVAAEEAKTTLSGSAQAMGAAWKNMLGSLMLGEDVKPAMQALVETVRVFLLNNLIPAVGRIIASLPDVIKTAGQNLYTFVIARLTDLTVAIKRNIDDFIPQMLEGLLSISENLREKASVLVGAGLNLIKALADGIIRNIPVFIQTVPTIISNFAGIINDNAPRILRIGVTIIKNLVVGIVKAIPVIVQNFPKIIKAIWDVVTAINWLNLGKLIVTGIGKGIKAMAGWIKSAPKKIVEAIGGVFIAGIAALKNKVINLFSGIKDGMVSKLTAAKDAIKGILNKVKSFFPLSVGKIFSNIKIPKINISGGKAPWGIGGMGEKPTISIKWAAKGMILDKAQLIGAGEAGPEGVIPLSGSAMRPFAQAIASEMPGGIDYDRLAGAILGALTRADQTIVLEVGGKEIARTTAPFMQTELNRLQTRNNRKLGYI